MTELIIPTQKNPYKSLGLKIKLARTAKNLTQLQVSKELNCSDRQISNYESGQCEIAAVTLFKLARVLNQDVGFFDPYA